MNTYGVITNFYDGNLGEELKENDHLSMIYTVNSDQLKRKNSETIAFRIHETVIKKVFEELKGFAKFYVYDCLHPES